MKHDTELVGELFTHNLRLTGKKSEALSALMTVGVLTTESIDKALRHQARRVSSLADLCEDHNPNNPNVELLRRRAANMRAAAYALRDPTPNRKENTNE